MKRSGPWLALAAVVLALTLTSGVQAAGPAAVRLGPPQLPQNEASPHRFLSRKPDKATPATSLNHGRREFPSANSL
jgi:hypothetical protein